MPTKPKSPKGKPVKKKALAKRELTTSSKEPIKIVIEVVLKDERSGGTAANPLGAAANLLGGAAPPIAYQITRSSITVLNLTIESKSVATPADSGTITLDFIPPTNKILVSSMATGSGSGSLQLTFNGKNLFTNPVNYNFTAGTGFINELVNLQ